MYKYQTLPCMVCKETSIVELDVDKLRRWNKGEHVQNVWPEKSADERELLISGTHPKCWDELFGEED